MTTIATYGHTLKKFANGEVNLADLKLELLNDTATFTVGHTAKTQVDNAGAYEVSGNGWDSGGEAIANAAITTVDTDDSMLDADDVSVTATGGAIGPAYKALLLEATSGDPLFFIDFEAAKTADVGTPFNVTWAATGIHKWIKT